MQQQYRLHTEHSQSQSQAVSQLSLGQHAYDPSESDLLPGNQIDSIVRAK